jgi:hypothetical protein
MWDKLGTSYYYILGPDSMDDFNERRNGVNDELGLLPSYTICSKCYTGKDDFWPGRNTIRKVVNFYNRWITPEISVAEILSTRLVDSDYARFRIGSEMDPRFIGVYYGYYFLDFAGYYGREGLDATDMLNLLYLTVKALLKENLDNRLVRRIFELRLMTMNGEFAPDPPGMSENCLYVVNYIMQAPLTGLYSFSVTEPVRLELERLMDNHIKRMIDRPLKSRKILEEFTNR